jgi:hypothetical protein
MLGEKIRTSAAPVNGESQLESQLGASHLNILAIYYLPPTIYLL